MTTSGNWYEPAFSCTVSALGIDSVLFAVDWPYEANWIGTEFLENLALSQADKSKLEYINAKRILNL